MKKLLLLVLISAFIYSGNARAEQVTILDTNGFTRGVSDVEGSGDINFSLVDAAGAPADGVPVTLTNKVTGDVLTAIATNGSVAFEAVAPGAWTVASTATGVTFTNISIAAAATAAATGVGAVGVGTALAGTAAVGGAAVAISDATNGSSDTTPLSPST